MTRGVGRAGQDVLDRLRRAGVRRAGARAAGRASTSAPTITSSSSSRTASAFSTSSCRTSTSRSATRRRSRRGTCREIARDATSRWCSPATAATSCSAATTGTCRIRASRRSIATARARSARVAALAASTPSARRARQATSCATSAATIAGRYLDAIGFFSADEKPALSLRRHSHGGCAAGDPERRLARHFDRYAQLPWPSQMMRFDIETYLPEDVLTKVDRMSMAHSIESRVPLLDNDVIEFASDAARLAQDQERPPEARAEGSGGDGSCRGDLSTGASRASASRSASGSAATFASCSPTRCCRRAPPARLLPAGRSSARLVNEHSPASATTRSACGSSSSSNGGMQQYVDAGRHSASRTSCSYPRVAARPLRNFPPAFPRVAWHPPCSDGDMQCERPSPHRVRHDQLRAWRHRAADDRAASAGSTRALAVHVACFHARGAWFHRDVRRGRHRSPSFRSRASRRPDTLRQALGVLRWCRERGIASSTPTDLYANIFALPGAALAGVPGAHRQPPRDQSGQVARDRSSLQRGAYECAHKVVANSRAAADRLRHEGVPARKIAIDPERPRHRIVPAADRRAPGSARSSSSRTCARKRGTTS